MYRFISSFIGLLMALTFISSVQANSVGQVLKPLSFAAQPNDFHYATNGHLQLITIYPAKLSSKKAGDFNFKAIEKGLCPMSITDIDNKAWYAPVNMVEKEMQETVDSDAHNPDCKVSGDHEGLAVKTWQLKQEITTLVVDGAGEIVFLHYGVLSAEQEATVFDLFEKEKALK